jgi:hypothetical protein
VTAQGETSTNGHVSKRDWATEREQLREALTFARDKFRRLGFLVYAERCNDALGDS